MPYQSSGLTVSEILSNYILSLYPSIINAILSFLAALIVFFFGWLVAMFIRFLLEYILGNIQLKEWFQKIGLGAYVEDFTWEDRLDKVLAEIGFWVVLIIFLMTSFDILGLTTINSFIRDLVNYFPKAIAGGLILMAGFLFGEIARKALVGLLRGVEKKSANGISVFIKWVIIVFSFLVALNQWGVAIEIINSLVMGLVLFVALAGGLAFGLGGQDIAREILESIKRHFR